MRKPFLLLSLFFTLQIGFSQSLPENFIKAKNELANKDYWSAVNSFKAFLDEGKYGNLANYAAFYSAEAYLLANQPGQAIEVLRPVYSRNWNKSDELRYLLAVSYFQNSQTLDGLRMVQKITNADILKKGYDASFEYVQKESSTFLVTNLEEFKANEGYTAALAQMLQAKAIMSVGEREALKSITQSVPTTTNTKNDVLDVVVILPFTLGTASLTNIQTNDFMYELYQGIELGVELAKSQGKKVSLQAFNSKRDLTVVSNLLKDPAIQNADVIIGPIYPDESDLVSAFAETNKIPFIHPLSNLGERFESTEYSYLFRPAVSSLSKGIISSLKSQGWGKTVAIGYSSSSRDERLAQTLEADLAKEGFQVTQIQKVDQRSVGSFLQGLGVSRGGNAKVSQIILLSDDPAIAQPTFSLMESITASVPLLVMDSWLGFNFANYEMLEFPNFYFISNNTPNFGTEEMEQFKSRFYEKFLAYPSLNSVLGAELVYWVDSNVDLTNGTGYRNKLNQKSFQSGKYTYGFNFRDTNNNHYSPVFKFENGELIPLN